MNYINIVIIILIAFIISVILTKLAIPVLRAKAGQNIREEGPESHLSKAGTPSMGGIAIIIGAAIAAAAGGLIWGASASDMIVILFVFVGFGLIGFFDDYLKVIKKNNLGLRAYQKFGLQIVISVILAVFLANCSEGSTLVFIPFANIYVDFGIWYIPFIVFVVLAMTNAVNLTDGLDGLASSVTIIAGIGMAAIGHSTGDRVLSASGIILAGSLCGFLLFNKHPAKIFMGDTGSMALGGFLSAVTIVTGKEFILPIIGLIYVLEALSVIIQVTYFKKTGGKRIFRMAPLHHHFELGGMSEVKVVLMFSGFTALCCLIGYCSMV